MIGGGEVMVRREGGEEEDGEAASSKHGRLHSTRLDPVSDNDNGPPAPSQPEPGQDAQAQLPARLPAAPTLPLCYARLLASSG